MKRLILALQFMTRLPLPAIRTDEADFAAAIRWFPAAGLVVGAGVACAWWLGAHGDPAIAALFALITWTWITGALHLDGLGDVMDAVGAAHGDRTRLLAVLADPHVGSVGVVAICLQLLAKFVLLRDIDSTTLPMLIVTPALARLGPLLWTLTLPPLHDGLGKRFRGSLRPFHAIAWAAFTVVVLAFHPALAFGVIALPAWGWWLRRSIGGIAGDGHGAGIEISETALLLAMALSR